MIRGEVNANREAVFALPIRTLGGQIEEIDVSVDTAFSGELTLSPARIAALQLSFFGRSRYELGNGRQTVFRIYRATVIWDGQDRDVYVLAADGGAMIGTELLYGYHLFVDMFDGGEVLITKRP